MINALGTTIAFVPRLLDPTVDKSSRYRSSADDSPYENEANLVGDGRGSAGAFAGSGEL